MRIQSEIIRILKRGDVGVLPTDTIYGIVGCALLKKTVRRIYKIKMRNREKPFIILISSERDLRRFGVVAESFGIKKFLRSVWPGKVSVIFSCHLKKFEYLHRGTNSLAFRLPKPNWLRRLLRNTGPLVAPSANPEGLPPAQTAEKAYAYFGDKVDFYIAGTRKQRGPSTLVRIFPSGPQVLRGKLKQK